jgi:DNA mismatch endonuclease (patch repair protein)
MTDIVPVDKRSEMISAIRGKDTKPEIRVRKALFARGYRYRLHRRDLPGTPDIVFPTRRVAIFVHGCFWHGHAGCRLAPAPTTRPEFWQKKIATNRQRDMAATEALNAAGWRVLVVWDCFIRSCKTTDALMEPLTSCVESASQASELTAAEMGADFTPASSARGETQDRADPSK